MNRQIFPFQKFLIFWDSQLSFATDLIGFKNYAELSNFPTTFLQNQAGITSRRNSIFNGDTSQHEKIVDRALEQYHFGYPASESGVESLLFEFQASKKPFFGQTNVRIAILLNFDPNMKTQVLRNVRVFQDSFIE